MAKGYSQVEGFDYHDTFSPIVQHTTVRTFFALASIHSWHLHQLDIANAFLNGDLEENIYMQLPPGYVLQGESATLPNPVCKLKKSIYGLKQASRQWNSKLTSILQEFGLVQSFADHSLTLRVHLLEICGSFGLCG